MIGRTARGYFGGGDGSATIDEEAGTAGPYQIHDPIHLYNLAWLQYIGYFKSADGNNTPVQKYFVLTQDIDMTGWALPPIGTEEYPFYGNFNGQGHKVTGLTVSNSWSDIQSRHPDSVNESTFTANIVGFFGVVGPYKNAATPASYSSAANAIQNTGLEGITVKSSASKTLVGLAAGYVNGPLEGVAVNDSYVDLEGAGDYLDSSLTTNISDYSLIGYAADKKYLSSLQSSSTVVDAPLVDNPYYSQGGDEWGSSIDMKTMYNNVLASYNSSSRAQYISSETRDIDINGKTTISRQASSNMPAQTLVRANGTSKYYFKNGKAVNSKNQQTASYGILECRNPSGTEVTQYMYLYGESTGTVSNGKTVTKNEAKYSTVIKDSSGYYMMISVSGRNYLVSATTNESSASAWLMNSSGNLYTTVSGSTVYLNASGNSVTAALSATTSWTVDDGRLSYLSSGTSYYLTRSGNNWTFVSGGPSGYLIYDSDGRYVCYSGSGYSSSMSTDESNATLWSYDSSKGFYTFDSSGSSHWFGIYSSSFLVDMDTSEKDYYKLTDGSIEGTGPMSAVYNSKTYYIYYNNGWTASTNASYAATMTVAYKSAKVEGVTTSFVTTTSTYIASSTAKEDSTYSVNATYFPLTWDKDDTGTVKTEIAPKNTGYVVAGANYQMSGGNFPGDIRVSYYETSSSLSASLNNSPYSDDGSNLEIVTRSAKSNSFVRISDDFNSGNTSVNSTLSSNFRTKTNYSTLGLAKYAKSREYLHDNLLKGQSNIYGLHFMNALINAGRVVEAPYASVLDGNTVDSTGRQIASEYYNYQLPEDSIDFNLAKNGEINFFAGTYFRNNSTFFSLHKVERTSDQKIDAIKEISQIYTNTASDSDTVPHVYKFSDNTFSPGTPGDLEFDTTWITSPEEVDNAMYYFEIPVNKGEYALGSVSGKDGAYLIYLDIGASGKSKTAVTITEHSVTTTYEYDYPKGVDFANVAVFSSVSDYEKIKGGETSSIILDSGDRYSIGYRYSDGDNASLTVGPNAGGGTFSATYKRSNVSVKNTASDPIPIITKDPKTVDILDRVLSYDALTDTGIVTTKHTVNGVEGAETSEKLDVTWTEEQFSAITNFDQGGVNIFAVSFAGAYENAADSPISLNSTYDALTLTYTLDIVSTAKTSQTVDLQFTSFNLMQPALDENGSPKTITYRIVVKNQNVSTGAASWEVSASMLNQKIQVVANSAA